MDKKFNALFRKIKEKKAKVGVIGLGYVGLPLVQLLVQKGFLTTGFVRSEKKAKVLRRKTGTNPVNPIIEVFGEKTLKNQDIFIICVQTPVTKEKTPDLTDLKEVAKTLSQINLSGKLIVNESTVAPFTTREIFGSLGKDYFLACSPERIDPGNKTKTTQNIPKVIGGRDKESLSLTKSLYQEILTEGIVQVSSLEAAEMTKMLENTYRAVNIALINEFAKLAETCGLDILEIIAAAKTKWSFQAHYPGIGVGGHCIPVDPYYILELAKKNQIDMKVVENSLLENEKMPRFVTDKIKKIYKEGMKVLVYGLTYKKDIDDIRESPVLTLCNLLNDQGISFKVYDPLLDNQKIKELGFRPGKLEKIDLFIIGTDHGQLKNDYLKTVSNDTVIVDGRNFFISKKGKKVFGVGRTLL